MGKFAGEVGLGVGGVLGVRGSNSKGLPLARSGGLGGVIVKCK